MTGTERQRKLLLHPSQKQTNQHKNTELITRSETHIQSLAHTRNCAQTHKGEKQTHRRTYIHDYMPFSANVRRKHEKG